MFRGKYPGGAAIIVAACSLQKAEEEGWERLFCKHTVVPRGSVGGGTDVKSRRRREGSVLWWKAAAVVAEGNTFGRKLTCLVGVRQVLVECELAPSLPPFGADRHCSSKKTGRDTVRKNKPDAVL